MENFEILIDTSVFYNQEFDGAISFNPNRCSPCKFHFNNIDSSQNLLSKNNYLFSKTAESRIYVIIY